MINNSFFQQITFSASSLVEDDAYTDFYMVKLQTSALTEDDAIKRYQESHIRFQIVSSPKRETILKAQKKNKIGIAQYYEVDVRTIDRLQEHQTSYFQHRLSQRTMQTKILSLFNGNKENTTGNGSGIFLLFHMPCLDSID